MLAPESSSSTTVKAAVCVTGVGLKFLGTWKITRLFLKKSEAGSFRGLGSRGIGNHNSYLVSSQL